MIVTRDNGRLYLKNWEYNACRIITALATVVENNGGQVKPQNTALISNGTLDHAKRDLSDKIAQIEALQLGEWTERRANYLKVKKAELEKMEAVNNEPILVSHTTYISFVLDNIYYYYQLNDNPFLEFYYQKTPVKNGKISRDAVLTEDKKEWLFDCFFSFSASREDIKEAANLIFNMLVAANNSVIQRDSKKVRVPNVYDGGYHYETVFSPERLETLGEWAK